MAFRKLGFNENAPRSRALSEVFQLRRRLDTDAGIGDYRRTGEVRINECRTVFFGGRRLGDEPHKSHALLGPLGVDATEKANSPFVRQEI